MRRTGSALLIAVSVLIAACTGGSDSTTSAFCERLSEVTGPGGSEVTVFAGDPERLPSLIAELESLLDRAPDEITTTTATLLDFFESYQRSPREDRRGLILEREVELNTAAERFTDFALDECGLILQRAAPTPIPTVDPNIEIAPE